MSKYEDKIKDAPIGRRFGECHDMTTGKPSEDYLRLSSKMNKELEDMGLEFKY